MTAAPKDNRFLIVTGLSGSGKTAVSRFLEDMGYYCVDNLPAKLIPNLVRLWLEGKMEIGRVALVIDIREPRFLADFPRVMRELERRIRPKVLFLDASDETLVKRFSESRRPHPLARRRPVLEGVHQERKRLQPIRDMADEVIDTSRLTVSELKALLAEKVLRSKGPRLQVAVVSFGYKYGLPLESDLVFDTRFLPNPFYEDRLRDKTGENRSVREYVLKAAETKAFLKDLAAFLERLLPQFAREGKSTLTVAVGCTGGKHRSVVVAEALGGRLKKAGADVRLYHRDIYK